MSPPRGRSSFATVSQELRACRERVLDGSSLPPSASSLPPPPPHLSSPVLYQRGTERHSPPHPQPKFVTVSKVPSPSSALLFVPSLPVRCGGGRSPPATGQARQPPRPCVGRRPGPQGGGAAIRTSSFHSYLFIFPTFSPPFLFRCFVSLFALGVTLRRVSSRPCSPKGRLLAAVGAVGPLIFRAGGAGGG